MREQFEPVGVVLHVGHVEFVAPGATVHALEAIQQPTTPQAPLGVDLLLFGFRPDVPGNFVGLDSFLCFAWA